MSNTKLAKAAVTLLCAIVATGADGMITNEKNLKTLIQGGFVEINTATRDAKTGNVAVRATDAGIEFVNAGQGSAASEQADNGKPAFEIESDIAIPKTTRGNAGRSLYPFDKLEVGQSFFVPATEDRPEPAKAIASTVSGANARYSHPDPKGETITNRRGRTVVKVIAERRFIVRPFEGGARVWRVEV